MATKKKVASKTTKKAVPAKKAVAKKAAAAPKKAAPKPAAAKKVAAAPKKAAAKKAAPKAAKPAPKKAAVKKVAAKAAPSKAVPAKKKAAAAKKPVKAVKPAPAKAPAAKAPAAKKPLAAKVPVKKTAPAPAPKAKPAAVVAGKPAEKQTPRPEPFISKPVEKVDIMASKSKQDKSDKEPVKKTRVEEPARRTTEKPSSRTPSKAAGSRPVMKTVTYSPEFTKSVLDQPEAPTGPIYRYSDPELQEFREIIMKKLEAAKKELVYLQGLITRKDEAGTDDTENKYMSMEDGSGSQEREQLNQMASRQIQFIDHLEKALVRIENKTYGICRVTGKLIEKARLKAVPHATLSIEAKLAKSK
jgi:RNA polymerase-binding transcription factor DksA